MMGRFAAAAVAMMGRFAAAATTMGELVAEAPTTMGRLVVDAATTMWQIVADARTAMERLAVAVDEATTMGQLAAEARTAMGRLVVAVDQATMMGHLAVEARMPMGRLAVAVDEGMAAHGGRYNDCAARVGDHSKGATRRGWDGSGVAARGSGSPTRFAVRGCEGPSHREHLRSLRETQQYHLKNSFRTVWDICLRMMVATT
jgi:hypothetical protein